MADTYTPPAWWQLFTADPTAGAASVAAAGASAQQDVTSWLTGIGGQIGSGIEAAFVAMLGDVWKVIEGPVEILLGMAIIFMVVAWVFKSQIFSVAQFAAMAA